MISKGISISSLVYNYFIQASLINLDLVHFNQLLTETTVLGVQLDINTYYKMLGTTNYSKYYDN